MNKRTLRVFLQVLIVISPLPLGCVAGIWLPLCFSLFALFALLAFLGPQAPYKFLYQRPVRVLAIAFFVLLAVQLLPLPIFLLKWLSPGVPRVLENLSGSLPAFHSLSLIPAETLLALARFLVYALFFIALLRLDWDKNDIFVLFGTAVVSGIAQAIFGLLKLGQGNSNFFLFFMPDAHMPGFMRGTIYNPDHFAFYLELLFPLALGLLFAHLHIFDPGQSLREKILHIAEDRRIILLFLAPILLAAAIYLTGCRSGIAVLVISSLFFAQMSVYLRANFRARRHLRLVFILATLLAVFIGVQSTLDKFLTGSYIENNRIDYWANTLAMFRDFPLFGTGLGTFKYAYFLYGRETGFVNHAHNEYVESLSEMGVLAFMVFFALLAFLVFSLLRMWIARRHPEVKPVVLGVLTALFAAIFHSFFDFSLRIPANAFLFLMILALGLKLATHRHEFRNEKE
ncbi:MAG: O-antigen ligase family protein [Candidatus Aminicenantes bacterium]|nr:O-antigen ligase family protein [Candidatus Aminicenantes bacterium]